MTNSFNYEKYIFCKFKIKKFFDGNFRQYLNFKSQNYLKELQIINFKFLIKEQLILKFYSGIPQVVTLVPIGTNWKIFKFFFLVIKFVFISNKFID